MPKRLLTPHGYEIYTAEEYAALAAKNETPVNAALFKSYIGDVEIIKATKSAKAKPTYRFTISTDSADRDNDIVKMDGMDVVNYRKNPVVFYAHEYRALPIGTSTLKINKHTIEADLTFVGEDIYPFAETVRRMVDAGVLRAASIGFKPKSGEYNHERKGVDIYEAELLEWSVVPVPANAECLVQLSGLPKGIVDQYAASCEQMLESIKGKGQWVVGIDLSQMQDFAKAFNELDVPRLMKVLSSKEDTNGAEHPGYPGCTREGGCPTNVNGSPENCTMADCPMKAQGGIGEGKDADVLAGIEAPTYEDEFDQSVVDELLKHIIHDGLAASIRESVRSQINYACGRVD